MSAFPWWSRQLLAAYFGLSAAACLLLAATIYWFRREKIGRMMKTVLWWLVLSAFAFALRSEAWLTGHSHVITGIAISVGWTLPVYGMLWVVAREMRAEQR